GFLIDLFRQFLALEHGVQSLYRADADPGCGIERIRRQALDDELFDEFEIVVGRGVLLELLKIMTVVAGFFSIEEAGIHLQW
ncbi:MAG TPA: hypothetical protein VF903_00245, partial [Nitrospirota bacterium]